MQTRERFKRTVFFFRTKHNMRIFGVIHFIKLQNSSLRFWSSCIMLSLKMTNTCCRDTLALLVAEADVQ